jgi:putative N6-adenine-specific DNA methylase
VLIDPMCGSATLLIEAALLAGGVPPGLFRRRFAFEGRPDFDRPLWERIRAEGAAGVRPVAPGLLFGADVHPGAIELARLAVRNAGLEHVLSPACADIADWSPPATPARVVVNPPYGERIGRGDDLARVYEALGAFLKRRCKGATALVLSGNADRTQHIGLKATRKWVIFNGPIECRLLRYDLY